MIIKNCAWCAWLSLSIATGFSFSATAGTTANGNALRVLKVTSGSDVTAVRGASGYVSNLRLSRLPTTAANIARRDQHALNFFTENRDLFLDANTPMDLRAVRTSLIDIGGSSHVRFQQSFKGIPVRGGEAIVHLSNAGVTSVESKLLADLSGIDMTPRISVVDAIAAARSAVSRREKKAPASLSVPQLEIINVERLRGKQYGESRLAWLIEATGGPDESIWVDAHSGRVILQVSRIANVLQRDVEDSHCSVDVGLPPISYIESGLVPTSGEALSAWNNAKIIYDYFQQTFGRDGLDGTNSYTTGRGTFVVNVCSAALARPPLQIDATKAWDGIALWDPTQPDIMQFGVGMAAADDVLAHEYTHALAAYMIPDANSKPSGFLLTGQSGALAEAFADIFGQVVDLSTNADTTGTRWDIGEAATGGPFRNLMNPNLHNQPGKVTDAMYYCGADDSVAIHVNSGVLSHAFALAVDGGNYNGVTVPKITGLDERERINKAARVFYKALDEYMFSTSSFANAYAGLLRAADDLVAMTTLTDADRTSIQSALTAVELQVNPCSSGKTNYCPTGQVKTDLFTDDFENPASGKWTNNAIVGVNHWNTGSDVSGIYRPNAADKFLTSNEPTSSQAKALSGNYALWADDLRNAGGPNLLGDSVVAMANTITLPDHGSVHLQFEHKFNFEATNDLDFGDADGGVIEYSIDGGTVWSDAKNLIRDGRGYQNFIQSGQDNPLAGRWAFVGTTNGAYVSTQLSLSSLAQKSESNPNQQPVKFRFRMGTDKFTGRLGWLIDDVAIYTCSQVIATPSTGLELSENGGNVTFTVQLASAPSSPVTITLISSDVAEGTVDPAELTFNSSDWSSPRTVTVTSVDDSDIDGPKKFFITIALGHTDDPTFQGMPDTSVTITNTDNDVAAKRKRKGGAWDVFSILLMLGLIWGARYRVIARHNS